MFYAWFVFYAHARFGRMLSPRMVKACRSSLPAGLSTIMGLAALYENINPPDPTNRIYWILLFAILSLLMIVAFVNHAYHQIEESEAQAERLSSQIAEMGANIRSITASDKPAPQKVEEIDKYLNTYVVAANAFGLVEEITRYLENNKVVHLPRLGPLMRALRGPIPWDQTPEATMARAYKEAFGDRLKALVEQFREIGIELPQRDEAYFAPGMYSRVYLGISQIKDAASRLVGDLVRAAGMRVAGPEDTVNYSVGVQASVGKPAASVQTTLIRRTTAKPEDKS